MDLFEVRSLDFQKAHFQRGTSDVLLEIKAFQVVKTKKHHYIPKEIDMPCMNWTSCILCMSCCNAIIELTL